MDFKKDLIESIDKLESTIYDFEYYTQHSIHYLDSYFDKLRNQVDIQREEILHKVNKFSDTVLKKIDDFYSDCKQNLLLVDVYLNNSNRLITKSLKNDLQKTKKIVDEILQNDEDTDKRERIRINIDKSIVNNMIKIENFKSDLLNKKICFFDPVVFNLDRSAFGNLVIIDRKLEIDENTGKCLKSFSNNVGDELINNQYFDLCMEVLDNVYIVMGNNRGKIKIWNIQTSECVEVIDAHKKSVFCLKKISNLKLASGSRDNTIKIWNLKNKQCLDTLKGHNKAIIALCLITHKDILVSGSEDKTIKFWNIKEPVAVCIKTIEEHTAMIIRLKLTQHNKLVSSSYDMTIKIWNLSNYKCENTIKFNFYAHLHFSLMSNNNIITLAKNKHVKIWDINTGECLNTIYTIQTYDAIEMKLLSDDYLLVIYENKDIEDPNYKIFKSQIWDLKEGICVKALKGYYYEGSFYGLKFLKNRNLVFCTDQFVRILNI